MQATNLLLTVRRILLLTTLLAIVPAPPALAVGGAITQVCGKACLYTGGGSGGGDGWTTYVIPSTGETVETALPSSFGQTYTIRVSGTYFYGDGDGQADCGYYTLPGQPSTWYAGGHMLWLDGAKAPCGSFSSSHEYQFTKGGTGGRLSFHVSDSISYDNTGNLVVTIFPGI